MSNNSIDVKSNGTTIFRHNGSNESFRTAISPNSSAGRQSPPFPKFGDYSKQSTFYHEIKPSTVIPSVPIVEGNQQVTEIHELYARPSQTVPCNLEATSICSCGTRIGNYCPVFSRSIRGNTPYWTVDPLYYYPIQQKEKSKELFRRKIRKILEKINSNI
jgi:hypothetical protein